MATGLIATTSARINCHASPSRLTLTSARGLETLDDARLFHGRFEPYRRFESTGERRKVCGSCLVLSQALSRSRRQMGGISEEFDV
jgi:hypothetical protein